jgi:hypothetical protein
LALSSMSAGERARVLDVMSYATARLEARLAPWGEDLADDQGDAVAELKREMAVYMPSLTAARELDRGSWRSPDLEVRVAVSCAEAAPEDRCVPAWPLPLDAGMGDGASRARFLAWAVTSPALVEFRDASALETSARQLRERTSLRASTLALVLTERDLALQPVAERAALQEAALRLGRAMAANGGRESTHLESLGRASPSGRVAPWLHLSPTELLVLPRLSAIAQRVAFVHEIEERSTGIVLWARRP